jgi:hypothetical protein
MFAHFGLFPVFALMIGTCCIAMSTSRQRKKGALCTLSDCNRQINQTQSRSIPGIPLPVIAWISIVIAAFSENSYSGMSLPRRLALPYLASPFGGVVSPSSGQCRNGKGGNHSLRLRMNLIEWFTTNNTRETPA